MEIIIITYNKCNDITKLKVFGRSKARLSISFFVDAINSGHIVPIIIYGKFNGLFRGTTFIHNTWWICNHIVKRSNKVVRNYLDNLYFTNFPSCQQVKNQLKSCLRPFLHVIYMTLLAHVRIQSEFSMTVTNVEWDFLLILWHCLWFLCSSSDRVGCSWVFG